MSVTERAFASRERLACRDATAAGSRLFGGAVLRVAARCPTTAASASFMACLARAATGRTRPAASVTARSPSRASGRAGWRRAATSEQARDPRPSSAPGGIRASSPVSCDARGPTVRRPAAVARRGRSAEARARARSGRTSEPVAVAVRRRRRRRPVGGARLAYAKRVHVAERQRLDHAAARARAGGCARCRAAAGSVGSRSSWKQIGSVTSGGQRRSGLADQLGEGLGHRHHGNLAGEADDQPAHRRLGAVEPSTILDRTGGGDRDPQLPQAGSCTVCSRSRGTPGYVLQRVGKVEARVVDRWPGTLAARAPRRRARDRQVAPRRRPRRRRTSAARRGDHAARCDREPVGEVHLEPRSPPSARSARRPASVRSPSLDTRDGSDGDEGTSPFGTRRRRVDVSERAWSAAASARHGRRGAAPGPSPGNGTRSFTFSAPRRVARPRRRRGTGRRPGWRSGRPGRPARPPRPRSTPACDFMPARAYGMPMCSSGSNRLPVNVNENSTPRATRTSGSSRARAVAARAARRGHQDQAGRREQGDGRRRAGRAGSPTPQHCRHEPVDGRVPARELVLVGAVVVPPVEQRGCRPRCRGASGGPEWSFGRTSTNFPLRTCMTRSAA